MSNILQRSSHAKKKPPQFWTQHNQQHRKLGQRRQIISKSQSKFRLFPPTEGCCCFFQHVHCADFLKVRKFIRLQLCLRRTIMIHKNTFRSLFLPWGAQHRNLHQSSVTTSRVTYFTLGPTQEPALATAYTEITRERFWRK